MLLLDLNDTFPCPFLYLNLSKPNTLLTTMGMKKYRLGIGGIPGTACWTRRTLPSKRWLYVFYSFHSDCTYKNFGTKDEDQEELSKSLDMKASSKCRDTRRRCLRQKELARQSEQSVEAKEPASVEELESISK